MAEAVAQGQGQQWIRRSVVEAGGGGEGLADDRMVLLSRNVGAVEVVGGRLR